VTSLAPAAVLFAILIAHSLLETARDALFLAELGPERLAPAYLAMAGCALVALGAVRRWGRLRDPRRMLLAFLVFATAGTAALAALITRATSLVFVLYMWTGFVATLVVPSFWTVVDRALRIGEAKRVFGAIGAGGVLGAMVGSAIAGGLGSVVAAHHLVTAGAAAFAIATVVAALLVPRDVLAEPPVRRRRAESLSSNSRHYVRLLLVLGVVSTIVLTLGDLTFKRVMAERLPSGELATAFGAIYTGLNAIGLAIQIAVTPRLLARWGVGAALTILPLIVLASALGFAITGATAAVIALKIGDGGLRHSLHRVTSEILYLPVPSAVRDGWKLVADAVGQRGGQAVAALAVFGLASLGGARIVAAATALAGVAWLVAIAMTRRAYIAQFRDTLQAGEIQRDVVLPPLDADSIALLHELVASPDEVEALAALDLLARRSRIPALVFYHPREAVVRHALSLLDGELQPEVARVLGQLLEHRDAQIRAAALAASTRTGGGHERLIAARADDAVEVRAVAIVALHDDDAIASLAAGSPAERLALADAIAFTPEERFRAPLYELLASGEPVVARRVLHVLARVPALADLDHLIPLLADPRVRGDVRRVFLAVGPRGLDALVAALDDPSTPIVARRHLPRTISRFRSPAAAAALVSRLPHEPDGRTEFKLLRALGRMRADDPSLPIAPDPIREYLVRAVRDAARYATLADYLHASSTTSELIREILVEKRRTAVEHAFRALGILFPLAGLRSVHDALVDGDDSRRSAAREIIEAVAPADVRAPLLAIVDDISPEERRARLGSLAVGPFRNYETFVAVLLADASESLRCVVARHVAERHLVALRGDLARLRRLDSPPLVTHAFDQAIARLDA
jgi:MFS family permease